MSADRPDHGFEWRKRDILWLPRRALIAQGIVAHGTFTPATNHYLWRNDDGSETTATTIGTVDTSQSIAVTTTVRLRLSVLETAGGSNNNTQYQLQVSLNGGTFQDVTSTSTIVKAVTSANVTEGEATTQQISSATFVAGEMDVGDGLAGEGNLIDYAGNDVTECEWVIQIIAADVNDADSLTFRVTEGGSAVTNSVTPTATVNKAALGGTIGQASEADSATALTWSKVKAIGQASETDTSRTLKFELSGGITGWSASNYLSVASPVTARPFLLACWMYCPTLPGLPPYSAPIGVGAFGASVDYYQVHWGNSYVFNLEEDDGTNDSNVTGTSALSSSVWYAVGGEFVSATSRQVHANALEDAAPDTLSVVMENIDTLTVGRQPASYVQNMPSDAVLSHFMIWDLTGFSATDRANLWTQIYDQTLGFGGDHARHPLDINADVGQAWSGALLWYVRGSSTSDLADQIGSANLTVNGTLSNSSIDAPVEGAPPGPTTVSIGQASETDSAQTLTRSKVAATGQASETDSAQALTPTKTLATGQAIEADTVQPLGWVKALSTGQASEVDSAFALTETRAVTVGQATEAETAQPFGWTKLLAVGQALETDSAQPVTRAGRTVTILEATEADSAQSFAFSKAKAVGQASDAETAQPLVAGRVYSVGQASEAETAQPFTFSKLLAIGQASESETSQPLTWSKLAAIGQALETDSAQSVARGGFGVLIGQASDLETAQPFTWSKLAAVGQSTEADSAFAFTPAKTVAIGQADATEQALTLVWAKTLIVGRAGELDTAQPVSGASATVLGQALEADSATALAWAKRLATGQATETDAALAFSAATAHAIGQAAEADSALPLTYWRALAIGQALESSSALSLAFAKALVAGQSVEADSATVLTWSKLAAIALAAETETAQAITHAKALATGQAAELDTALAMLPSKGAKPHLTYPLWLEWTTHERDLEWTAHERALDWTTHEREVDWS